MILVVDNYDSFTFNLVQLLYTLGAEVCVVRNDAIDRDEARTCGASHVLISPGPCSPREAGVSVAVIADSTVPVLGVCLGHQCIATAFGGHVVRAPVPVHGKSTAIRHDGRGLFNAMPAGFEAGRYHSLIVEHETLPDVLEPCAWNDEGLIMAMRHRTRPIAGVQFHPESVLTPTGAGILRNFLEGRL